MGSLQRRLRNCLSGARAEPFAFEAQELAELELHFDVQANGMTRKTSGVLP